VSRRLQVYRGASVEVTFEPARCIHAAACVRGLPAVFDAQARPWIRPDAATPAEILAIVARCPTGALRATAADGTTHEAFVPAPPIAVRVARHGPLFVQGEVTVVTDDGSFAVRDTRVALCRCGLSARKPFCDGSHRQHGWRDDAPPPAPTG
jgi:uncharacterized Fe-S cluster protein YjdI/CDGSH-type Zn-finger protein